MRNLRGRARRRGRSGRRRGRGGGIGTCEGISMVDLAEGERGWVWLTMVNRSNGEV